MIIPGFNKYSIDANGIVTCVATGQPVKVYVATVKNRQYAHVKITGDDGHVRVCNVLTLMAIAYLGKPLHKCLVRAKDGNNLNTRLDNVVCTTRSEVTKLSWQNGSMSDRRQRERCYDDASITMVYEAMQAYDVPVSMSELSSALQVPYGTIRYSMRELRNSGKVCKTKQGFEVIR